MCLVSLTHWATNFHKMPAFGMKIIISQLNRYAQHEYDKDAAGFAKNFCNEYV